MLGERAVWISKISFQGLLTYIFINDHIVRKPDTLLDEMFDKLFHFCASHVCRVNAA